MEETTKPLQRKLPDQEIDYYKIVKIIFSRWYWVASAVIICSILAKVYLWYTPKTYATGGTLKLEEKKSELPDLATALPTNERPYTSRVQSETIVLQSNALLLNVIKQLDYRMSFYIVGRVVNRTNELYPSKPLDVELVKFDSLNFFNDIVTYKPINQQTFSVKYKINGKDASQNCRYNVPFLIGNTGFNIKGPSPIASSTSYIFKLNAPEDFIGRIRSGLHISETAKNSNIMALQETDSNPQFAADVLNGIMKEYLRYDRTQKMQSATQMIKFIDTQMMYLSQQVAATEKSMEKYKQSLKIVDLNSAAGAAVTKANDLETQRSLINIQLIAIDQLKSDIVKGKDNVTLNFNMEGVVDPQLQSAIEKLDNLIYARNSLLKTYNSSAQPIKDLDQQILGIKSTAINDINIARDLVEKRLKYLNDQMGMVNQKITQFPVAENDMAGLQRRFSVNEKVYDFLSEKKLNAQISRSGILPGATIVDAAQPNFSPVAPDENGIRRSAIILGLAIGFGLIVLIRILNPYIYDKETIESLTTIPIIGVIRKFPETVDEDNSQVLALSMPKSVFAESVRSVRTNLNFIAAEKKSKIICVTSEIAGEGKSFMTVNLSSTLSLIDKKIILIAADLRRSRLHKTFKMPNDVGLSNYLARQCDMDSIIRPTAQVGLDIILSGPVPPNPSELLHSQRMETLLAELKKRYDVIMIDTAPVGLVADSIPLIRMSDINIFVIRSGKSKFYAATVPQRIANEYHLDNTFIILNAYVEDLLHSRYYTTKFTGENHGTHYYYYSDYSAYEGSDYYIDKKKYKWWHWKRWIK
jgi:capsular exopolysaccharide synthesis family protein